MGQSSRALMFGLSRIVFGPKNSPIDVEMDVDSTTEWVSNSNWEFDTTFDQKKKEYDTTLDQNQEFDTTKILFG